MAKHRRRKLGGNGDETVDQNVEDPTNDEDNDAVIAAFSHAVADVGRKPAGRIPKKPNVNRTAHKEVWTNG